MADGNVTGNRVAKPILDDGDIQLYHGDVIQTLRQLPAGVAQTCITSPPYWGLRDYGTGQWTGGDPDCDHKRPGPPPTSTAAIPAPGYTVGFRHGKGDTDHANEPYADVCGRCGARREDSQLGLEATPTLYVERMVAVFREVWRVLRPDGTVWLNLGDSYFGGGQDGAQFGSKKQKVEWAGKANRERVKRGAPDPEHGLKFKDLVGIPWRVAFALQTDGWYLRSDIIWSKPNPMPESVTDRPTKAHEYLFLLTKQPRYYMDMDAIREPNTVGDALERAPRHLGGHQQDSPYDRGRVAGANGHNIGLNPAGRNRRSVWTIPTQPYSEAHFATFPEALVRPCILAGTSERGECSACGAPWMRETSTGYENPGNRSTNGDRSLERRHETAGFPVRLEKRVETTGWRASCSCDAPTRPQTCLDPFVGSGTTALVARKHGRRCIGIDLSSDYLDIAARRLQQLSLFAEPA